MPQRQGDGTTWSAGVVSTVLLLVRTTIFGEKKLQKAEEECAILSSTLRTGISERERESEKGKTNFSILYYFITYGSIINIYG